MQFSKNRMLFSFFNTLDLLELKCDIEQVAFDNKMSNATENKTNATLGKWENICIWFEEGSSRMRYFRTHNLRVCLYIAYIECGSASLCI